MIASYAFICLPHAVTNPCDASPSPCNTGSCTRTGLTTFSCMCPADYTGANCESESLHLHRRACHVCSEDVHALSGIIPLNLETKLQWTHLIQTPEMQTLLLCGHMTLDPNTLLSHSMYIFNPWMRFRNEDTSVIRSVLSGPSVSRIEGIHCIWSSRLAWSISFLPLSCWEELAVGQ